jgi:hypothetical protein
MPGFVMAASALVLAALAYLAWYRPWQLTWGTSAEDVARRMPGDNIVRRPIFNATRSVTIRAEPAAIWPWIVQIGFGRAGWYSYDLLDNLGRHSAERIVPELQTMKRGDLVPMGPGDSSGIWVKDFVVNAWMLWWSKREEETTWTWALYPQSDGSTRLVTRVRAPATWRRPLSMVWLPLLELADFPMMRKCMLGIKRRAESTSSAVVASSASRRPAR